MTMLPILENSTSKFITLCNSKGFPSSSACKESACNARDSGSIPMLRISPAEGIGYSLQYSLASLVAQTVKNLPAMQDTRVPSLGWEDPLEQDVATHFSILDGRAWSATVHGVTKSQT